MQRKNKLDVAASYREGQKAGAALAPKVAPWIIIVLAMLGAAWGAGFIP